MNPSHPSVGAGCGLPLPKGAKHPGVMFKSPGAKPRDTQKQAFVGPSKARKKK